MKHKRFNKQYFDKTYKDKGGIIQLEKMIKAGNTYQEIGNYFGITRQRVGAIMWAYKHNAFVYSDKTGRPPKVFIHKQL